MNRLTLLAIAVFMLCGAGAFWAGMAYRGSLGILPGAVSVQSGGAFSTQSGSKPPPTIIGQVSSKQSSGFVVKAPDGSMKSVLYTGTTSVTMMTMSTESPEKVSVGDQVFVIGFSTGSGALDARSIQISRGFPTVPSAPGSRPATPAPAP